MLPFLNGSIACIRVLGIFLLLAIAGCSSGDLGRSEAKKKLSKVVDMCNPCYVPISASLPISQKLFQSGYLDPETLQLTPLGLKTLGENAVLHGTVPGPHQVFFAAFKKEIDEVTGIAPNTRHPNLVDAHFTYRIIPINDLLHESQVGLETLKLMEVGTLASLSAWGTVEQSDGKFIAYHTSGTAQFVKYDDGWRIQRPMNGIPWIELDIHRLGGFPQAALEAMYPQK
jgi:hypothetical protein